MNLAFSAADADSLSGLLRTPPAQSRSNVRVSELLDAAAKTVQELGYERLTTAMVATRSGASIGTVYRYFPDRISVLQGLAARNLDRFSTDWLIAVDASWTWRETLDSFFDWLIAAFRTEPGFRSLRFGDVLDLRPRESQPSNLAVVALAIGALLEKAHPLVEKLPQRIDVAITLAESLLDRAFALDDNGDPALVLEARRVAMTYFAMVVGDLD